MNKDKQIRYKPHNLARLDILDAKRRKLFSLLEVRFGKDYR